MNTIVIETMTDLSETTALTETEKKELADFCADAKHFLIKIDNEYFTSVRKLTTPNDVYIVEYTKYLRGTDIIDDGDRLFMELRNNKKISAI